MIHTHKELIVWQKGIQLVTLVYQLSAKFSREEVYGLTSQIRRCAVSMPSNIAEGRCRGTKKDFLHFLRIAYGSSAELETQLEIAKQLSFLNEFDYNKAMPLVNEMMRMLRAMIQKLNPSVASRASLQTSEASEASEASNEATPAL